MIAMIVTENQYLRRTLSKILVSMGYHTPLTTAHIDEASFFLEKYGHHIRLILVEDEAGGGFDLPLARLIIQKSELNYVPLIFVSHRNHRFSFFGFNDRRLSRIDYDMGLPFNAPQLSAGIVLAHRRRAQLRNRILYFGARWGNSFVESIFAKHLDMHWQEVIEVHSVEEVAENLKVNAFRIGGVIIEPTSDSPALVELLRNWKRTYYGAGTPLLLLSTDPEDTLHFRTCTDLFSNPSETDIDEIVSSLSRRIVYQWDAHEALLSIKEKMKLNLKQAEKTVLKALKLDANRWEFLKAYGKISELKGDLARAKECYGRVLKSNPCDPSSYLSLIPLAVGDEKVKLISQAKAYCPHHPQIQQLSEHA